MTRPIAFINADLGAGQPRELRVQGRHFVAGPVQSHDLVVDLNGDRVLPGLINAHEHLQLNHFPHVEYPGTFGNVREWIADVTARLGSEPAWKAAAARPLAQRHRAGGLKNLLSGVTTVAHHDPLTPELGRDEFPCRVLQEYGWAHSLQIDGAAAVRASREATPAGQPWIIHAAEGVDAEAAAEFGQLEQLGCLRPSTLLVHAVALTAQERRRLADAGGGVIWCPSSNLRLFGRTAALADLVSAGRVALGSDSRISAGQDLLQELAVARAQLGLDEPALEALVTSAPARLLRLPAGAGTLRAGAPADLVVLPAGMALSRAGRAQLRLVMIAGTARYGDEHYVRQLLPAPGCTHVRVDARPKLLHASLAAQLTGAAVTEPGVEYVTDAGRVACG